MDFARIVSFHRRRAGLSRVQLAGLAGVGKTVIFDIEHGKDTVRLATLLRVLTALNVHLDWSSPLRAAYDAEPAAPDRALPPEDGA
ncbi:MAG TPA: helix-turn-helix domain-containing protein [bacterium]|nr:helix-turn-helix domain-containing protein [bacterium]